VASRNDGKRTYFNAKLVQTVYGACAAVGCKESQHLTFYWFTNMKKAGRYNGLPFCIT
jgi:hypothetical protein